MFNLLFVNTYYVKRIEMATYNALYKSTIIIIIIITIYVTIRENNKGQ